MLRGAVRSNDHGFTIVEILFATVILFFLLTSLLTTLNVSMTMSNKARYGSVGTNLAAQQLELARTLAYGSIGLVGAPSGEPSGTLVASESTTAENMTFTIVRDVEWVDDPADGSDPTDTAPEDYKRLTVTVSWNHPVSAGQLSMATNFRESEEQGIPPNVEFSGDTPVAGAIIHNPSAPYGAGANDGQVAVIHGTATQARWQATADDSADPSGGIASLTFFFDGLAMVDSFGETCSWAPVGKEPIFTRPSGLGFTINSLASTSSTQYYPDGRHQIRVETWDDSGMRDFRERLIYVDNFAPNAPSSVSMAAGSGNETRYNQAVVWWPAATDGNMNAASYDVYRNPITGVGGYVYKQRVSGTSVTTSTLYNDDIQFGSPPFPNGSVRVWYFGAAAVSMSGWPSGITYSGTYMVSSPGMAGRTFYQSGSGSNKKYRLYLQWGDRSWNTGYDTLMKYDLAMSSAASTSSPPNLFTNPGVGGTTELRSNVASSSVPVASVVCTGSSTTTWTVTWDSTSSAANPHFDWRSTQDLKTDDAAALAFKYVQIRARVTGSPVTGTSTVYSNMLGPIDLSSAGSTYLNVAGGRVFDPPAQPNF
jgi:type II secretory pathway pseudopilin PulG